TILDTSVQEKARRPGASLMACRYIEATVDQYGFDRERLLKRECAGPRSTTALQKRPDVISLGATEQRSIYATARSAHYPFSPSRDQSRSNRARYFLSRSASLGLDFFDRET